MRVSRAPTIRYAIAMSRYASPALAAALAALLATPASAGRQDEPAATRQPDARDVAMTPVTDLNLSKDEIPEVLVTAALDPYAGDGLKTCKQIGAAIAELDAALGPDMDVYEDDRDRIAWGKVASSAVGSFIPFRGILREITGAADHRRDFQSAIYAGSVRRGFLKGLGQQKGCDYPARPAFTRVVYMDKRPKAKPQEPERVGSVTFVSEEVVQEVPGGKRNR